MAVFGREAHNNHVGEPHKFLKKGDGSLASENRGETEFAKKRKEQIISEQIQRESDFRKPE